jgi:hypothetical protein
MQPQKPRRPSWWGKVDRSIQKFAGTTGELRYFVVMHIGLGKILWEDPETYETACGVRLSKNVHDRHTLQIAGLY